VGTLREFLARQAEETETRVAKAMAKRDEFDRESFEAALQSLFE
jgi:hypothetical protein